MVFLRSEEEEFISVWDRVHSHIMMGMFTFVFAAWLGELHCNQSAAEERMVMNRININSDS